MPSDDISEILQLHGHENSSDELEYQGIGFMILRPSDGSGHYIMHLIEATFYVKDSRPLQQCPSSFKRASCSSLSSFSDQKLKLA